MVTPEDVKKLAALARLNVEESELAAFTKEFDAILSYVGQLEAAPVPAAASEMPALRNVMREDKDPHETGIYTEKLVAQFPEKKENYLSVKQIIKND